MHLVMQAEESEVQGRRIGFLACYRSREKRRVREEDRDSNEREEESERREEERKRY